MSIVPTTSRRAACCAFAFVFVAGVMLAWGAGAARAAEWFIDPNGSATAAGTISDPWDISKLNSPTAAAPGDTVWLRGGVYYWPVRNDGSLGFTLDLRGEPNNPVTVRNYNGERAIIDGGLNTTRTSGARHVRLWGLEVTVSEFEDPNNDRTSTESGSWPLDLDCPNGGIYLQGGTGIHVINCYIHHARGSGIGWWAPLGDNSSIHGTIIYSNGWIGPDRWHGHGIYAQNETHSMRYLTETLLLENYGNVMNIYGSMAAEVDDFTYIGNVCKGYPAKPAGNNTNIASGWYRDNHIFDDNIVYEGGLWVGYDTGASNCTVTNNYLIRGAIRTFGTMTNFVTSGNVQWWDPTWDGDPNKPYDPPPWTAPPIVDLRVNDYEPDRANVCLIQPHHLEIYNPTIAVDFGSWLSPGEGFELKDPRDLYGPAVYTGAYTGSIIDVPVDGECTVYVAFKLGSAGLAVDAGADQALPWPANVATLDGTVTDYGDPPAETLTQTWAKLSGPGTVTFADADSLDTTATFSTDGTYVLRLTASDTERTASDTVTIALKLNEAPTVDAGANGTVTWPSSTANLDGTVTDDGLPAGSSVTQTWSKVSGPGSVTFADANAEDTKATFSALGTYVLQLLADDSALTATDTVTITVRPASAILFDMGSNNPPNAPETDGRYWNHLGRAETANAWDTIVGNAVDEGNTITGVGLEVYDIQNQNKNLATAGVYPYNAENDGWNYSSTEGSQAIIRITGLNDQATYTMKIHSAWPSDPWWYASGKFTCQGTSYYYDNDGAVIYTWTGLMPNGGEIDLEMNTWLPAGQNPISGSVFSIELIELTPEISSNDAPTVDAGPDASLAWPASATSLDGTVSDDGLPATGSLTILWTKLSGPGAVVFADAGAADTTATFSTAGTYVLELYAFDGGLSASDLMTVIVQAANAAPSVGAGADQAIAWPRTVASLDGTVLDDGLPSYGSLTTTWSKLSGPGAVTFANASAVDTDVTFAARGQYVLRLTASDGALSASDEVTVVAGLQGDFDGDGLITADDVDLLYAVLDTTVPPTEAMYDLTEDGQVTFADAQELVEVIVGTSMADTNLDMKVDIQDLGNVANLYGFTGTFSDGDTNGDAVIDLQDLGNLANDYGKTYP